MDPQTQMNLFHMAIQNEHIGIIKKVVDSPEDLAFLNRIGGRDQDWPIHMIARTGSIECLEAMIGKVNLLEVNKNLDNIVHLAVAHRHLAFVKHLVRLRRDMVKRSEIHALLVAKNRLLMAPLEYALYVGSSVTADVIARRTNLKKLDFKCASRSLFYVCAENNNLDALEYLFDIFERKYKRDSEKKETLLKQIISLAYEPDENTVFHLAAQKSNLELIKYLIEKCPFVVTGGILFKKNRVEQSCFHLCCIRGFFNSFLNVSTVRL